MTYDEFLHFLDKFEEISSFAGRIRAANENLTRLASGSGRVVYDIDGEKVLKAAKNPKGVAQNDEEANVSAFDYNHDVVTKVFEYDNQNGGNWIVSEKAKKVGEKRIKELTGIPSLYSLNLYLREFVDVNNGRKASFSVDEKDREILDENEWVHELKRMIADHAQEVSDMGRPSTYGEVIRDGKPAIVLSDYGLSDEIYRTHYAPKRSGYNLYELVDMNRGEIYQEFTDGNEIRNAWWGFQPYNPPDGEPAFVNENFVKLVEARENFMMRRPIFNLMSLAEEFHGAMNGIQEYVNKADNQKKFFKNLVNLQEYLVEQGVYNRDQLLFEEDPPVEKWSLERNEADELAILIAKEVNLPTPNYLGEGGYGQAYRVGNQVLKITSDVSEADAGMKIKAHNPKTLVEIYNIWKIVNNKTNKSYYALLEEYVEDKPIQKFREYMNIFLQSIEKLTEKTGIDHSKLYYKLNKRDFNYDTYIKLINDVLYSENDLGYSDQQKQDSYKFMRGLGDIKQDLLDSNILKGSDYLTLDNLGYSNGVLTFFDVGGYRAAEPTLPEKNILRLNEEKYSQEMTNKITKKVGEKFNVNKLEYMDSGLSGDAYDIGNDVVLKITSDRSEMIESLHLVGKKLKHVADIYTVYEVKSSENTTKPIYVIMLEKLDTKNKEIESKLKRLMYAFNTILDLYLWDIIDSVVFKQSDKYEGNKTQIEKYFNKNPQDKEFFNDLVEMVEEIRDNNIESDDYRGGSNLGYKKDGSLGFFDLGFGDVFKKSPLNPKQLNVGEDGSAKFSSDNSIGRDDFPAYNNKDTSPSIENDLNANSAMYYETKVDEVHLGSFNTSDFKNITDDEVIEQVNNLKKIDDRLKRKEYLTIDDANDMRIVKYFIENNHEKFNTYLGNEKLVYYVEIINRVLQEYKGLSEDLEYSHVKGDATDDEYMLGEEQLDDMHVNNDSYNVFKNPKSIKNLQANIRGIVSENGDLYVIDDNWNIIHNVFAEWLKIKGYPIPDNTYYNLDIAVPVQRYMDTNHFFISESIPQEVIDDNRKNILKILQLAKKKNPTIKFHMKSTYDADIYDERELVEERIKSYMPKSKTVTVKKKCRLGGLGNTSVACNQGDINNLEFGSINETNIPYNKDFWAWVSPENQFVQVPKLNHKDYIMQQYKDSDFGWDYDKVFDQAIKDGWVRVTYEYNKQRYSGNLSINGSDEHRVRDVFKNMFFDLVKYGNNIISLGYENPKHSWENFSTRDSEGKANLASYLAEEIDPSEAYNNDDAIQSILDGKRDVAFIRLNKKQIKKVKDAGLEMIGPVKQDRYGYGLKIYVLYRDKNKGQELYDIAVKNGGYLPTNTPEETRRIGELLGYYQTSIDKFIEKRFGVENVIDENNIQTDKKKHQLTPDIKKFLLSFDSDEKLLRSGGIPTELLDQAAYGFHEGNVKELMPDQLVIKWHEDLKNVKWEVQHKGLSLEEYAKSIDLSEPIDVVYENGAEGEKFYVDDGHHRYFAAKILNKPLKVNLTIKANPITKLGGEMGYDEFHRYVWKQVNDENSNMINEAELMSLQDLPFKNDVEALGGKIYSVGGAVRDEFLGKESKDLDILITGIPMEKLEAMMQPYGKVDAVGKSFGVLKFKPEGGEEIDVAVPRTETATGEGGHKGFDVTSDHTLPIEKDLERRDFTINAIAKDIEGNLTDPFGGQKDLQDKIIRVVNPEAFSDDPLRMLRAVQFASRFGFTIEPKTMELIKANAGRINEIPPERILTEFDKIVKKGNVLTGVQLLQDTGLFKNIFGFDLNLSTIGRSDFEMVKSMGEFIYLMTRLAANPAELYKDQLKGDIETHKEIKALEIGMDGVSDDPIKNRSTAYNMYHVSPKTLESKLLTPEIQRAATELLTGKFPKSLKELAVNGNDLMQLGFKGKEIGDKLKSLLINVYAENVRNDKEELLSLVSKQNPQNLSESKYSDTKKSLSMSKSLSKDMKEKIEKYLGGGSSYHEGGRLHGLKKPKVKGKQFKGVGLGADKDGFYVYTHRAASKRYKSPDKIPQKDIDFIETTG